jgi:hypothetical protein
MTQEFQQLISAQEMAARREQEARERIETLDQRRWLGDPGEHSGNVLRVRSLERADAFATEGAGDPLRTVLPGLHYDWCLFNRERLDARQGLCSWRALFDSQAEWACGGKKGVTGDRVYKIAVHRTAVCRI